MISKLRRVNRMDNPFEVWELYIDDKRYIYRSNPADAPTKRDYPLSASAQLITSEEDETGCYLTVTRWALKNIYLPMNSSNYEWVALQLLLWGEKSVEQELNGCI